MTAITRTHLVVPAAAWILQWSIASLLFVLGMLEVGLHPGGSTRGLLQAAAAVVLVVPSASRILPVASPLMAAVLAFALVRHVPTPGELALAVGCLLVAFARGVLVPVEPDDLRAERIDPLARDDGRGAVRRKPEPRPRRPHRPGRVHAYLQKFAHR